MNSGEKDVKAPFRQSYDTAVLFADVSGFTKLSEFFANKDPERNLTLCVPFFRSP